MRYLDEFERYMLDDEKSENTVGSYLTDLKQFHAVVKKNPDKWVKEDIEKYKAFLRNKDMKIKTINRKLVSINQFMKYLNDQQGLNIFIPVKLEKQQRQDYLDEMLDKKDIDKLVKAAGNDIRAKAIFYTLLYTGVRVSEMLQLTIDDVEREFITIKGKGSKYRDIFVPARVRTIWIDYLHVREKGSQKLFTGQRGAINRHTVDKIIKDYAVKAGVSKTKAHAHNFRHLYCKMLVDQGHGIDTVADLAGHSDINTTRIYTRKTRKELMEAINGL